MASRQFFIGGPSGGPLPEAATSAMTLIEHHQNEISRIVSGLVSGSRSRPEIGCPANDVDHELSSSVLLILQVRDNRRMLFDGDLFADPAWDMLLEMFLAHLHQKRMTVGDACIAARAPSTTGLRWLKLLEERGLVSRRADALDGRRTFVALSELGLASMRNLIGSLSSQTH